MRSSSLFPDTPNALSATQAVLTAQMPDITAPNAILQLIWPPLPIRVRSAIVKKVHSRPEITHSNAVNATLTARLAVDQVKPNVSHAMSQTLNTLLITVLQSANASTVSMPLIMLHLNARHFTAINHALNAQLQELINARSVQVNPLSMKENASHGIAIHHARTALDQRTLSVLIAENTLN